MDLGGSNGNENVFHIPQSSRAEFLPSDSLASYPGHMLGESYPSAEIQPVYSTTPANWAALYLSMNMKLAGKCSFFRGTVHKLFIIHWSSFGCGVIHVTFLGHK